MTWKLHVRHEYCGAVAYNASWAKYFLLTPEQRALVTADAPSLDEAFRERQAQAFRALAGSREPTPSCAEVRQIINPTAHPSRISAPLKVFFNITKRCNLFCTHCYNDSGHPHSPELNLSDIREVFRNLQKFGVFKVTIAGGEPLFHRQFDEVMESWSATDIAISVVTNGICLNERRAAAMGASMNIRSITVSLDGSSAADNDIVRGKGTYSSALRGLRLLRKHYDRDLAVRITLMQTNVGQVDRLPAVLSDIGVHEIKVNPVNPYGRATARTDLLLARDEYLAAREQLLSRAQARDIAVEVPSEKYQADETGQIGLCRAGEETCEIDGDGSVYPCSFSFGRFRAGNVRDTSFEVILENLQKHSINNAWCYACKGRGGKSERAFGPLRPMIQALAV